MNEVSSNGSVLNGHLQVLHVPVLFVAPLGSGHMAQPGTDQHEVEFPSGNLPATRGATADLPVQPFKDIVGADTSPGFAGNITVGQRRPLPL